MAEAEASGVEHVVTPWTQRVQRGRACCLGGVSWISGSSRQWVRIVVGHGSAPVDSHRSRLFLDSDSDDESDGASEEDEQTKEACETKRGVGHRAVAEWLLLLQALAGGNPTMVPRALAQLQRLTQQLKLRCREGQHSVKELGTDSSLGFEIAGDAASLSVVLALLTHDQDALSAEFKQARATILAEPTQEPTRRSTVAVRIKVNKSRRDAAGDTTDLDQLAPAIRDSNRWLDRLTAEDTSPIVIDAVDFDVDDYCTLEWLADTFPTDSAVGIGQVTCSGDLGLTASLEAAVKKLLHGDGEGSRGPPQIQNLVLQNPLDGETLRVVCSVIQSARSLQAISVNGVLQDYGREPEARARRWQQFAIALFGRQATHHLQRVDINEWALLPEDVRVVVDAIGNPTAPSQCSPLKIASLDLSIGGVQGGTITPLVELVHAVRSRLPRLADLTLAVSDDPAINDAVVLAVTEDFATTLRNLSLTNVELDSLGSLLSPTTDKRLRLRSLHLHNLFIGDMASCSPFFEKFLGDVTNPIVRHLEVLRLGLSKRHTLDDVRSILFLVQSMLQQNPRILHCEIDCHDDFGFAADSLKSTLASIHGQPTVEPLRATSRAAFLSIFQRPSGHSDTSKKPRIATSQPLSRPHQDGIAHIFALAASATTRVALVRTTISSRSF